MLLTLKHLLDKCNHTENRPAGNALPGIHWCPSDALRQLINRLHANRFYIGYANVYTKQPLPKLSESGKSSQTRQPIHGHPQPLQCLPPPNLHTCALKYPSGANANTPKAIVKYAMRVCSTAHTSGLFSAVCNNNVCNGPLHSCKQSHWNRCARDILPLRKETLRFSTRQSIQDVPH